jgi:tetratricopeptide (TPR) repeat protein
MANFKTVLALLILFLFNAFTCFSENFEYLSGKTYEQRTAYIAQLHVKIFSLPDSAEQEKYFKHFTEFTQRENEPGLELESDYLGVFILLRTRRDSRLAETKLKELINKAKRKRYTPLIPRLYTNLAGFYRDIFVNYEKAYECCAEALKYSDLFEKDFPEKSICMVNMGDMLYKFQDYDQCSQIMKRAIELPTSNYPFPGINQAYNTIGLCFQNQGLYDSAEYYYKQLLKEHHPERFYEWEIITKGALGYLQYLKGNPKAAIPSLENCVQYGLNYSDTIFAASSCCKLSQVYQAMHNMLNAEKYAMEAEKYARQMKSDQLWDEVYTTLIKIRSKQNNPIQALQYLDSSLTVKKRIQAKTNALQLVNMQQAIHSKSVFELEQAKKIKTYQFNFLLCLCVLVGLSAFYLYKTISNKLKYRNLSLQDELLVAKNELNTVKQEFEHLSQQISEKNNVLIELEQQLVTRQDNQTIHQLRNMILLTDEQWNEFQILFEKVFPGYLDRLKGQAPKLSPNDLRIIALSKLELLPKQMANMLGVSVDAIRVSRYRLMKKLNLSENESLENFLEIRPS